VIFSHIPFTIGQTQPVMRDAENPNQLPPKYNSTILTLSL
jgi:hypothetical protein